VRPTYSYRKWTIQNAAKLVAGTTVQSFMMVVALLSGGQKTACFWFSTSTKNAELEESNPEMGLATRVITNNAGIIEATTGICSQVLRVLL
jgi:hypothetical protein